MSNNARFSAFARSKPKKERTRALLLDAAGELMAKRGPLASVSEIAAQAGVAIGTFYNHFCNREELLEQLSRAIADAVTHQMEAALPSESDHALQLARGLAAFVIILTREPDWGWAFASIESPYQPPWDDRPSHVLLRDTLRSGVASGRFTADVTDFLDYFIFSAVRTALRAELETPVDHYPSRQAITLILCALGLERAEAHSISETAHSEVRVVLCMHD